VNGAEQRLKAWREDPRVFVREVFNVIPDKWQDEALARFPTEPRIAMKACKGPGKTALEAWIAWNFLSTRPHPKVVATSITAQNLQDNLWAEMSKWQKRSPLLEREFEWTASRITYRRDPENWFMSARSFAQSANLEKLGQTLAGVHADYVLFILDESGGIPVPVLNAAEGAMTTGVETKILQGGNTNSLEGALYHACSVLRSLYHVITITGDPDDPNRSPRIDIENARKQIALLGRDDPTVRINILGEWPSAGLNQLYAPELVETAMRRDVEDLVYVNEPKVLGVDVARFGDDRSVIGLRQGLLFRRPQVRKGLDTVQLADQVAMIFDTERPAACFIDETGIGAGVVDTMRARGYPVIGVQFGAGASDPRRWLNKRVEMWDEGLNWLKRGGCLPLDPELRAELCAPHFWFNPKGQKCLESKEDLVKRGLPSPDKGDAYVLTFAGPVASAAVRTASQADRTVVTDWNPLGSGHV
jgi:phage terminase large subunit